MTDETEPEWLTVAMVADAHSEQLAIFGGPEGIRDQGLLESAVARAPNKWAYGERDLAALASAYAFEIARNHPFVDGNKRAAFTAIFMFLGLNAVRFRPVPAEATAAIMALAAGELDEDQLARWIRDNMDPASV